VVVGFEPVHSFDTMHLFCVCDKIIDPGIVTRE